MIILIGSISLLGCNASKEVAKASCTNTVVINAEQYEQINTTNGLVINSLKIEGDCLKVSYSSSGCSAETWELQLIDSGAILESLPPQRNLVFSFKNEEMCQAYFTKEATFNISSIKEQDGKVWLNIKNTDKRILYE